MTLGQNDQEIGAVAEFWIRFALGTLATWRVSHMLASEDGPWEIFVRLRRRMGNASIGRLMDCFGCLSIWIALPTGFWVIQRWEDALVCWLAISGGAFLLEKMQQEPVIIERLSNIESGD